MGTRKFSNFVALLERNSRTIIAILVTLVILSGVVYSVYLGDALRFLPDEKDYYDLATNVAFQLSYSLDGENPTAYRPPGYPLFLSIFRYLGTSVVILRILNFLIFGLGIYLVYKTLQKEYSPLAGLRCFSNQPEICSGLQSRRILASISAQISDWIRH